MIHAVQPTRKQPDAMIRRTRRQLSRSRRLCSAHWCLVAVGFSLLGLGPLQAVAGQASASELASIGFEASEPGEFETLRTSIGNWVVETGTTRVDDRHAKSGKHCLQLTGGEMTRVQLDLADDVDTSGTLSFWAERWTSRSPFRFRIEKQTEAGWREIYNGDSQVRVGRAFLNHVRIPLADPTIKALRFTCASPPKTGILIDDLRIAPATKQRILRTEVVPFTLPALRGTESSRLLQLKVTTSGSLNPIALTELEAEVYGADKLQSIAVGHEQKPAIVAREMEVESTTTRAIQFKTEIELDEGENTIWITCRLRDDAEIDQKIGARAMRATFSNGKTVELDAPATMQRLGVAVRKQGDDGVHTCRIPGLATTTKGTLIGVYDVRRRGGRDLPGDIDVGMSRSSDGGRTWEPMKVIMDMGDDPQWRYDGIGDPAILVDQNTGTIWVAATWSHGNRSWVGSGPGLDPEETGQLMLVRSDDDGVTWSQPINITSQVKNPEWSFLLQGPGKGITMRDGTIVFAAQYQDAPENARLPHSTILYSRDHGKTWQVGTGAFDDTTEAQVVEIAPGVLMLNCRYNRQSTRVVMTTDDLGKTWKEHSTSQRDLIEPRACMASLINVDRELGVDIGGWLLFSNPDSTRARERIMIKASNDNGSHWPKQHRLLLDEGRSAGYSCMTMIDRETVGIFYEGSQAQMSFQRIPLKQIISDQAAPKPDTDPNAQSLSVPRVFGHHMVLQADAEIAIWGKASAGRVVSVRFGREQQTAMADSTGNWQVRMRPRKANAHPAKLTITSAQETIEFTDVLIGEVWICAGQSNMEWSLAQSTHGRSELERLRTESSAGHDIRLLHLIAGARGSPGSYTSKALKRLHPEQFFEGQWQRSTPESAHHFSAVGWYFGRRLADRLNVPIGLICPAVGGTPTEAWIPREALAADPTTRGLVAGNWLNHSQLSEFCRDRGEQNLRAAIQSGETIPSDEMGPNHPFKPSFMWSAGIEPLIPYSIRGVIWYQGESNAESIERVIQHRTLFPKMVRQWRQHWRQDDFPFIYAQLPAMDRPAWPLFREFQRRFLDQIPNVGMAITIDTGERSNVHPRLKRPIGERLANCALANPYGLDPHASSTKKADIVKRDRSVPSSVATGPLLRGVEHAGDALELTFEFVGDSLQSSDQSPLRHFQVCGENGIYHEASATIIRPNTVRVSNPDVGAPVHARYGWQAFPTPPINFVNSEGLPASPFSTQPSNELTGESASHKRRPNILLIVSEDNSDHLGCYGEQRVHTPHLDSLAANGVRYTRAYVPYPVCSPSRASFLTGLYTRQNGHIGLATHRFEMWRDFKTIPAYFRAAGYYVGFLGKTHVNPDRLVEDHVDHRAIKGFNFNKTIGIKDYADEALQTMRKASDADQPFLLIINYADAHRKFVRKSKHGFPTVMVDEEIPPFPWIGSDSPNLRRELRDYFNCMNRLDEGIGMVLRHLDEMQVRDDTLIVYLSDHGADFPRGKGSLYENGTRIPLILQHPEMFAGGKVNQHLVSTIDLLPTMLLAAGIQPPAHLPGFPLQNSTAGRNWPRRLIHTFTTGAAPGLLYVQFGIRDDRYKLIYNPDRELNRLAASRYENSRIESAQHVQSFLYPPEFELFDLQADPNEWRNLADDAEHQSIKQKLLDAMHEFQTRIEDPFAKPENLQRLIAEQKEHQTKKYKIPGFRWPHLEMFGNDEAPGNPDAFSQPDETSPKTP